MKKKRDEYRYFSEGKYYTYFLKNYGILKPYVEVERVM